jgi:hypothetical protein
MQDHHTVTLADRRKFGDSGSSQWYSAQFDAVGKVTVIKVKIRILYKSASGYKSRSLYESRSGYKSRSSTKSGSRYHPTPSTLLAPSRGKSCASWWYNCSSLQSNWMPNHSKIRLIWRTSFTSMDALLYRL